MAAPIEQTPGPTQIGPYRMERKLAEGGMGVVYEAIQEPIGRRVALKILLPEYACQRDAVTRFFNEARAVNLIEHPSIVQVSEFGYAPDGTAFLVMEFVRGESLASRLEQLTARGQRLPVMAALQLCAQLADALTAAHAKGIVHRDMKPSNVMLARDSAVPGGERAKILDFGIAKLTQPGPESRGKGTATDVVMGTPQYMSPEQCRGAGVVDERTDVYALGVILFEILAGRTPFLGEGSGDFIGQHMFKEPPVLSSLAKSVPEEVCALVDRLLVKDKDVRPAMYDVHAELTRLLSRMSAQQPVSQPPAGQQGGDGDETLALLRLRSSLPAASPSTLGHSLGQTLNWQRRPRQLLFGGALLIGMLAVAIPLLTRSRPAQPLPQPALQPTQQASASDAPPETPPIAPPERTARHESDPIFFPVGERTVRRTSKTPQNESQPKPAHAAVEVKGPALIRPAPTTKPALDARPPLTTPKPATSPRPQPAPPKRTFRVED